MTNAPRLATDCGESLQHGEIEQPDYMLEDLSQLLSSLTLGEAESGKWIGRSCKKNGAKRKGRI